jgi:hypothetical protein
MRSRFQTVAVLLVTVVVGPAACRRADPSPTQFGGTWTLELGARVFAVLVLEQTGDRVAGTLSMPEQFEVGQSGLHFTKLSHRVAKRRIADVEAQGNRLHFVTVNPKNTQETDAFDMTFMGPEEATLNFSDAPFDPWTLKRLPHGDVAAVSTDWEATRSYSQDDRVPSSAEMEQIFQADQQPRKQWVTLSEAERAAIAEDDAERRRQAQQLPAGGRLHTAEDFKRAAFVFQHGSTPEDYLLAHTLAMVAVAKGDAGALWIASATLDRYLQAVGRPQVYGTQFAAGPNQSLTQEPYNRCGELDEEPELIGAIAEKRLSGVHQTVAERGHQVRWNDHRLGRPVQDTLDQRSLGLREDLARRQEMNKEQFARELNGGGRGIGELPPELILKGVLGLVRPIDEACMKILTDRQRPDRPPRCEQRIVTTKRGIDEQVGRVIDGLNGRTRQLCHLIPQRNNS